MTGEIAGRWQQRDAAGAGAAQEDGGAVRVSEPWLELADAAGEAYWWLAPHPPTHAHTEGDTSLRRWSTEARALCA